MAKQFIRLEKIILLVIGMALLWGCGGAPLKVTPVDKTQNPTELINQLGQGIADARTNQVNVLSPTWFKKAETSYTDAKRGLEKGAALAEILDNIARGRAELQQAQVVAIQCRDQLADAIQSRAAAQAANAQQFTKDYADAENDFLKMTRAMEDKDFQAARSKSKEVSRRYRDLELRAITLAAIGDARQLIQKAQELKVPKIAPKSFAEAQTALTQAEAYIADNRYDRELIQQKAAHAKFMAQRTLSIAEASRKIEEMAPEDVALWIESFLSETTSQLKSSDRRDVPFKQQETFILAALAALKSEYATAVSTISEKDDLIRKLNDRLAEVEGTSQRVKYDKDRLAAEKRFNELFVLVQGYFDPDEAEVYKQLDKLVIRLKGINFPVGQAVVQPASYPLLTKVQRAIRTFGQPDVVIEGHTDSTGSAQKNQALSTSRAESVKQYLVANGTLSATKITAVGHGSSRPIASNETAAGRAQNRRIDVIIKPQMKEMK